MISKLVRVLKKRVSGFDSQITRFRVRVFKNVSNWRFLAEKNAKMAPFGKKNYQISVEIAKLAVFGPQNGDYDFS